MAEITKIALTGGPCGGKTAALSFLQNRLEPYGVEVITVSEQATELMSRGVTPDTEGSYAFHRRLFENQLAAETQAEQTAERSAAEKVLILCDRGLLDSRAYVTAEDFAAYAGLYGFCEDSLRNRYDAVFHLVTAAQGAEEHYQRSNNAIRSEDASIARQLDDDLLSLWVGTQHLRIVDNRTGFAEKLDRLLRETLAVLGIPEPLEIERKFLIAYPEPDVLDSLPFCRRVPITQAYLNTPEEGQFRVRKRGEGAGTLYIKTVKEKINDMKRVETETLLTEAAYNAYLMRCDCVQGIISKDRYCIAWQGGYYELDVYPFWRDRATLEIELLAEDQVFSLPDCFTVIRDVTAEKQYRNKTLAATYGKLFAKWLP